MDLKWLFIGLLLAFGALSLHGAWWYFSRLPPSAQRAGLITGRLAEAVAEFFGAGLLLGCTLSGRFDQFQIGLLVGPALGMLGLVLSFDKRIRTWGEQWYRA